jgi:O-antigen/teichoic acid export membrane protein
MSLRRRLIRLSLASVSPMCVFFLRLVRTMILSHLLLPNDLGAAIALMSILAGCEMITDVGLDRFVMVTGGEDRAQAVAAAQQIAIVRGIVLAAAIAVFSPALASIFGARAYSGNVAWLALVPLIGGFRNWRLAQIQQDYRYGPEAIASVCGQLAAVTVIVPAFVWLHDERALLVSLITEAVVQVALSRVLVRPEPVAAVDPSVRKAAILWGLPLMINGIGLMALKQLDQVVVANLFDLQTLALYALGLNLAITPTSPLQGIAQKIGLPLLGNARANVQVSRNVSLFVLVGMACVAAAYALAIGVALDRLVPFLYGRQYRVTEAFCALAMFDAFLRFCRGGPNMILLQHSLTGRLTVGNLTAGVGIAIGLILGVVSRRIEGVMVGLVIGDLLSLVVLVSLLHRHLPMRAALTHIGVLATTVGLAAAMLCAGGDLPLEERTLIVVAGCLVIGIDALVLYRHVGRWSAMRSGQSGQWLGQNVVSARRRAVAATLGIQIEPPTLP